MRVRFSKGSLRSFCLLCMSGFVCEEISFYSLKKMNAFFPREQKISGKKLANFYFSKLLAA